MPGLLLLNPVGYLAPAEIPGRSCQRWTDDAAQVWQQRLQITARWTE
jgi:hypothetical protein